MRIRVLKKDLKRRRVRSLHRLGETGEQFGALLSDPKIADAVAGKYGEKAEAAVEKIATTVQAVDEALRGGDREKVLAALDAATVAVADFRALMD